MTESYAARMARYVGKPRRVTLAPGAPVSAEVMNRTMGRPAQRAMMQNTADIYSRTVISSDPIAQAGALDTQQGGIRISPQPMSEAYGLTFGGNLLPSQLAALSPESQRIIAGAGGIGGMKDRIVIGPEAAAGEATSAIPHELGHRGMNVLGYGGQPQEKTLRVISILRGEDLQQNLAYMDQEYPRYDGRGWTPQTVRDAFGKDVAELQNTAGYYLRQRGLK